MKLFQSLNHLVHTLLFLVLSLTAAAQDATTALPPELASLDAQFEALKKERVILPFELDLARLNAGYLGGLDQAMDAEKAKGDLDATLALKNEKQAFTSQPKVSDNDDPATPATLRKLRATYRSELAKINTVMASSLVTLTDPLSKRLVQMEKDLTKVDRLEDAKKVRAYREALAGSPNVRPAAIASNSGGFTNTFGMKFVPVKGTEVMFCIHEVRFSDYAAYAAETPGIDGSWKDQSASGYEPTENKEQHPVIKISRDDAQGFCTWLSKKEGKTYRLPTDQEWSVAVGLGRDEKWKKDTTPATVEKNQTEFPWGDKWPPPKGSGNYSDDSRKAKAPNGGPYLENYDDGFPTTAPVMSFKPNKLGLYDLEGNVREWVEDWYGNTQKERVLRGGCWHISERDGLLSSARYHERPGPRGGDFGFRCVLVVK